MGSSWAVEFERGAAKSLGKLDRTARHKVVSALERLAEELTTHGRPVLSRVAKLKGTDSDFRLRVDDWRVIFQLQGDRLVVLVLALGHRREIYRP
jgi:mRNA interferase RelE/StbE